MPRKLKVSLASSVAGHPIIASILLDNQAIQNAISVTASTSNYSTYEFDVSTGDHVLKIRCDNESLEPHVDLNLVIGPIQLSKLDGTYHENLYLVPDSSYNLHMDGDPDFLYTRVLFYSGDVLEFNFNTENPSLFRDYAYPTPPNPNFEAVTGQVESEWVEGQIAVYDELKYQYQFTNIVNDDDSIFVRKEWVLLT